uniref:Uncharacterized protein n=1 Tax=Arundo donax TaxID=35708 RepID=A0A0A9CY72_ARUDO
MDRASAARRCRVSWPGHAASNLAHLELVHRTWSSLKQPRLGGAEQKDREGRAKQISEC